MPKTTFYILCSVVLGALYEAASLTTPAPRSSCPTCTHMESRITNVPSLFANIFNNLGNSMNNPDCVNDPHSTMGTCSRPLFPSLMTTKCVYVTVHMRATGMKFFFTDAVMELDTHARKCISTWIWEKDGCTDFREMSEETQNKMKSSVAKLETQWRNVTYSGKTCVSAP